MKLLCCVFAMAAGVVSVPATAHALCSCAMGSEEGGSFERPWVGRQAVFTGYALHVESAFDSARQIPRSNVLFVTQESWRGALPDTVSLFIDAGTCEYYTVGHRYLVTANWDRTRPGRLVRRGCDYSWEAGARVAALRKEEGPPRWVAPPAFTRKINERAIPLGTRIPRRERPDKVVFMPPRETDVARFEIGDFAGVGLPSGTLLYLDPGLYQVRVTWRDGVTAEGFALMWCPHVPKGGHCSGSPIFAGLRATPPPR